MFGKLFGKKKIEEKSELNNKNEVVNNERKFHPMVMRMANLMQDKLDQRLKKYPPKNGVDNWLTLSVPNLLDHFEDEFTEFEEEYEIMKQAAKHKKDIYNLIELKHEAADICNLLGMVIDKIELTLKYDKESIKEEFSKKSDF